MQSTQESTGESTEKTPIENIDPNTRAREGEQDGKHSAQEKINKGTSETKFSSLADALKIPVEDKSSAGEEQEKADDVLEDEFFSEQSNGEDAGDGELFEDYELMADIGVELIDLVVVTSAKAIGGGDESEYSVSQTRRNKLKKPLAQLLKQRQVGVSPEIMVVVMVAVIYSPVVIKAFANRKKRKQEEKKDVTTAEQQIIEAKVAAARTTTVADRQGPINHSDKSTSKQERTQAPASGVRSNEKPKTERKKRVTFASDAERMEVAKKLRQENEKGIGYGKLSEKYGISVSAIRSMIADAKKAKQ